MVQHISTSDQTIKIVKTFNHGNTNHNQRHLLAWWHKSQPTALVAQRMNIMLTFLSLLREWMQIKLVDFAPASDNAQFMRPVMVNRFPTPDLKDSCFLLVKRWTWL